MTRKRFKRLIMSYGNVQGRVAERLARSVVEVGTTYAHAYSFIWPLLVQTKTLGKNAQLIGLEFTRKNPEESA